LLDGSASPGSGLDGLEAFKLDLPFFLRGSGCGVAFRVRVGGRLLALDAVLPRPVRVRKVLVAFEGDDPPTVEEVAGTMNAGRK